MTRMLIMLCTLLTMIGLSSAQAEEPTVIALSCDGTTKAYVKRKRAWKSRHQNGRGRKPRRAHSVV